MADFSSNSQNIEAPASEVAAVLVDLESFPSWSSAIKSVEVQERDGSNRPTKAIVKIEAGVLKDRATLNYDYSKFPNAISFSLEEADLMTAMNGKYTLKSLDSDTTLVTYELGVELSLPVPRMMISKTEKSTIDLALKELQAQFE